LVVSSSHYIVFLFSLFFTAVGAARSLGEWASERTFTIKVKLLPSSAWEWHGDGWSLREKERGSLVWSGLVCWCRTVVVVVVVGRSPCFAASAAAVATKKCCSPASFHPPTHPTSSSNRFPREKKGGIHTLHWG
jgi:hypothetical protein